MASRHETRVRCVLPVKVAGTDLDGNRFERLTCTLDISDRGARITGIPDKLRPEMELEVSYKNRRETFRVAWVGSPGTRTADQIGLLSNTEDPQFWPELRKQSAANLEEYANRERQAQERAKKVAAHVTPSRTPPPSVAPSPTERLKLATEELFELAKLIERGSVEPAALQEFRQALGYVRNTSWMLQQWFELQQNKTQRLPLLTMLNSERMRLAANLCNDLSAFLATTKAELDVGLIDHFIRVVVPLLIILRAASDQRAQVPTAATDGG